MLFPFSSKTKKLYTYLKMFNVIYFYEKKNSKQLTNIFGSTKPKKTLQLIKYKFVKIMLNNIECYIEHTLEFFFRNNWWVIY